MSNIDIREIWSDLLVSETFDLIEVTGVDSPKTHLMRHKEMPEFAILLARYQHEGNQCHGVDFLTHAGEKMRGWFTACWCCIHAHGFAGPNQECGLTLDRKEAQRAVDVCCLQHGITTILCRNTQGFSESNGLIIVSAHRWLEFMSYKYAHEKVQRGMWPIMIHQGYAQK